MNQKKVDLDRLKVKVMKDFPFFGALLHRVSWEESTRVPTAGIDKNNKVVINPEFWNSCDEHKQNFIACHEIFHGSFLHTNRVFRYTLPDDQILANIAADYLINFMLVECGLKKPDDAYYDINYTPDKYTLETLVEELRKNRDKYPRACEGYVMNGGGAGKGNDLLNEGKDKTPAEQRQEELDARMALANAVSIAKKRGNVPGSLERFVDDILKPKQNWREELQEWFNVKLKEDTTWNRPNRRHVYRGIYLPTKWSEGCGHIGVAIDVSGSIGQHELAVFQSELNHIFELCKPTKVTVVYFDATIQRIDVFDEYPIKLKSCGGGGTEFNLAFDHFNKDKDGITGLVFMTDMYGEWPEAPNYPVCVLSTTEKMEAPFGKTVYADLKNEKY